MTLGSTWKRLQRDAALTPAGAWRPLPWQHRFLASRAQRRLLRAGNQVGKTTAGVMDLIAHASGDNPWCPAMNTPAPIEAWVICASWSQSLAVQKKIWQLLPRRLLHPRTEYDDVNGFSPVRSPAILIKHVSGGYSTVLIKTVGQGGLNLSSATIQYAWFDEPPKTRRIYTEVTKRVQRAGSRGRLLLTMTPVNAEVGWLQELAETGAIEDHHVRLEAQAMIPMLHTPNGWRTGTVPLRLDDGTPCDADWVNKVIADTPAYEVPVVCHGEWRASPEGAVFSAFRTSGDRSHVTDMDPTGDELRLFLGIDHGVRQYTQVAVLIAQDMSGVYWVLDEYVGQTETTDDDDADGILSMLERHGLLWFQLDEVFGDRAHYGQPRGPSVAAKSNSLLSRALVRHPRARQHRINAEVHPAIRRAKSGVSARPGSVEYGCAWLHRAMVADKFRVNRRCVTGIASMLAYDGSPNSPESHWVDALRYGLRNPIWAGERLAPAGLVMT